MWNHFIGVCLLLSLDGWTAESGFPPVLRPQTAEGLTHSHTTKCVCIMYNQAAPPFWFFSGKKHTHTQTLANTHVHLYANTAADVNLYAQTGKMGHVYPSAHKSQYQSSVKLCRASQIVLPRGSLMDGL